MEGSVYCCMTIACALRWEVALVGFNSVGHYSPRRRTPFQVQGMCRETTFTRGRYLEESMIVALIYIF